MRILLINKYHYIKGGADTVFFNTSTLLQSHGHEVVEFCTQNPKNLPSKYEQYFAYAPELRDLGLWGKLRNLPKFFINKNAIKQLERLITDLKPDVAHIHNIFNGISLAILPVLKKHQIPTVITIHDTRFICPSSLFNSRGKLCETCLKRGGINCGIYKCYQNNLINSWMCAFEMLHKEYLFDYNEYIDKYIFVSHKFKDHHQLRHSYFQSKGCVLYNFLPNLSKITPKYEKGKYLFFYGRITEEKGITTLIETMKHLPHLQLRIAGTGQLLNHLKALNLKNVIFLGFKSGEELFNELRNSSFVIVPSECEENNPLTIIESYAHGKPVIGSRIGGIPEIINDNTGFLFETSNKESLIKAINRAMNISNEEYYEMSVNARKFAETHFDANNHYYKLTSIYQEVIKNI